MKAQFDHAQKEKNNQKRSTENVGISMPSTILVHAQLELTNPGDSDEKEAEEIADSIVNGGKITRSISVGHSGSGIALPSQFGSQLASFQGQGSRITGDLKNSMESSFGQDFSDVRLHTDNDAAEMSSSISAKAFTYGNDIYFNRGQYNPESKEGQHLIAHELTHIIQKSGKVGRTPSWANLSSNYPDYDKYASGNDLFPYIFGSDPYWSNQGWVNTCATRVSVALLLSGVSITGAGSPIGQDSQLYKELKSKYQWEARRSVIPGVSTMNHWLRKAFGEPTIVFSTKNPKDFDSKVSKKLDSHKGILYIHHYHITLWDGKEMFGHYYNHSKTENATVYFWEIK